ncbi:ribonuclease D [Pasteurellaceae bacterium Macca]|nr:ribonuclease D [Pasteurellaceae bacterium Macca]
MNQRIQYQWIQTNEQLGEVCRQASEQNVIALDTEFVRIRSFYPKLGLIQLFDGQQVSLIDPLTISDFSPFVALLANPKVLKVLHACGEDLEVFQHRFQQMPEPMLDTQIMAGFAGIGVSMGFAKLVQHYLAIELDKGASRTDWLARPLSAQQLQYAAADVWYLLPIYQQLSEALAQTPWQSAVQAECQGQIDKRRVESHPDNAYKEIGNAWQLNRQQLAVLQVIAKWRYLEAQKRDLAVNFVVKEQSLWQIAKTQPKHTSELLDFMHPNEVRLHGKKLLWLVEQGRAIPPENYPLEITRLVDEKGYKITLKALQTVLNEIKPPNLAVELLASKRQLNQLFKWHQKGQSPEKLPELLKSWREPFGKVLCERCFR